MTTRHLRRTAADDEGFTLIELLISISITLIILSSISAALLVFLSNGKYAMKRDDHSSGAVLLSSYLDRDFASSDSVLPPVTAPATCATATTILTLTWTDYSATAAAPTPASAGVFGAKYVVSSDTPDDLGDATCKLSRVYARGASAASLTTTLSTEVLVRNMPARAFSASASGSCGSGTAVTASLAQYATDTTGLGYSYTGCLDVRQS
ncbi:MAG: hypothetical protein JWP14_3253 [Frankiales bacterium]|jgi:prepilin-type N-terminal cleavage/methylation domain-containing protein|nr:hypothetical protein [Frankiales bacterium]